MPAAFPSLPLSVSPPLAVSDKETAEELNKRTLKLSAKVALLWRENLVTKESAAALREPMIASAVALIEHCEMKVGSINPAPVCEAVQAFGKAMVLMVTPHMKEKNVKSMREVFDFYSTPDFLGFLFNSVLLVKERDSVLNYLHTYMSSHGGAGSKRKTQPCTIVGCELPRINVRGSVLCHGHHAIKYAAGAPLDVLEFLGNAEHASCFKVRGKGGQKAEGSGP